MSNNSFNIGNNWNKNDLVKKEARGSIYFKLTKEETNKYKKG